MLIKRDKVAEMRTVTTQIFALLCLKELWQKSESWRTSTGRRIKRLADGNDDAHRILQNLSRRQGGSTTLRYIERLGLTEWGIRDLNRTYDGSLDRFTTEINDRVVRSMNPD